MAYGETKVYFDGSHYIAIPHTTRLVRKRPPKPEEIITVVEDAEIEQKGSSLECEDTSTIDDKPTQETDSIEESTEQKQTSNKTTKTRTLTKKELFEEVYKQSLNMPKFKRKSFILSKMKPYFDSEDKAFDYVNVNMERKQRNAICKRIRMTRKANLQRFNYFCTFTYNGDIHTEETFKQRLKETLNRFSSRKGWKYMGVWERSPKKKRLHFHGIFYIPDISVLGPKLERRDYSFSKHDMVTTYTFDYFERNFGRTDFEEIDDNNRIGNALAYLMKYIEKSGERIVYSRGLPQYFISDIMDDDIVCTIGQEDKKLLLFDDFGCWNEGCYIGQVSPETIKQMRKAN